MGYIVRISDNRCYRDSIIDAVSSFARLQTTIIDARGPITSIGLQCQRLTLIARATKCDVNERADVLIIN